MVPQHGGADEDDRALLRQITVPLPLIAQTPSDTASAVMFTILLLSGAASIVTLILVMIFGRDRDGMLRKIRKHPLLLPSVVFLACVLVLPPFPSSLPTNAVEHCSAETNSYFLFNTTPREPFTRIVLVRGYSDVSTSGHYVLCDLSFRANGSSPVALTLNISVQDGYSQDARDSGSLTLPPDNYNVSLTLHLWYRQTPVPSENLPEVRLIVEQVVSNEAIIEQVRLRDVRVFLMGCGVLFLFIGIAVIDPSKETPEERKRRELRHRDPNDYYRRKPNPYTPE